MLDSERRERAGLRNSRSRVDTNRNPRSARRVLSTSGLRTYMTGQNSKSVYI